MRKLNQVIVGAGPYRTVTRRHLGTGDLTFSSRLIDIEVFRQDVVPQALPVTSFRSILVLAPHCDDEAIGVGGSLLLARNAGARLAIAYCTDSEQYCGNKDVRWNESKVACEKLGAEMWKLEISNIEPRPNSSDLLTLREIIKKTQPDVIFSPWILDAAPKHRMVNHILWLANKLEPLPAIEIWGYQVQNSLLPTGFVDITEVADEKRSLLKCFESQNAGRHWDHVAMGSAAWNSRFLSRSDRPLYAELFFPSPVNEFLMLVERLYFSDLNATYLGEREIASHLASLHEEIVSPVSSKDQLQGWRHLTT